MDLHIPVSITVFANVFSHDFPIMKLTSSFILGRPICLDTNVSVKQTEKHQHVNVRD